MDAASPTPDSHDSDRKGRKSAELTVRSKSSISIDVPKVQGNPSTSTETESDAKPPTETGHRMRTMPSRGLSGSTGSQALLDQEIIKKATLKLRLFKRATSQKSFDAFRQFEPRFEPNILKFYE